MRAPDFWYRTGTSAKIFAALLSPLSLPYRASALWKKGTKGYRAKARVLCVGNLTVGGTGKTPIALALAEMLQERDMRVAFLTRGYGGSAHGPLRVEAQHSAADVGDEALLLARSAPTIVARERAEGAKLADSIGADIIVMDDGYQNMSLQKDMSLLVIDAEQGFGNGHLVPAGPLREPIASGLARADGVIWIGDKATSFSGFTGPQFHAVLAAPENEIAGRRVVAFAGIGRPQKFFDTLKNMDAEICGTEHFADHHAFSASELKHLRAKALTRRALLVTTEKDFVRLPEKEREGIVAVPVRAVFKDSPALNRLLDALAAKA